MLFCTDFWALPEVFREFMKSGEFKKYMQNAQKHRINPTYNLSSFYTHLYRFSARVHIKELKKAKRVFMSCICNCGGNSDDLFVRLI